MHILRRADQQRQPNRTLPFEGEKYGANVSLFLVDNEPGDGPPLHRHPYPETWIVRGGKARMNVDGEEVVAEAGDILVVGPDTPHKFTNIGEGRLDIICIHASNRFIQENLE
jgi:mannose-6-phosphate isomerase-like protein (cupin superfamily)